MRGLNDRFKRNPEKFLGEVVLQEIQEVVTADPPEGIYDFDFQPTSSPRIVLFDTARPGVDPGEELIRAYWLPWKSGTTLQLELRPASTTFSPLTWEVANYG